MKSNTFEELPIVALSKKFARIRTASPFQGGTRKSAARVSVLSCAFARSAPARACPQADRLPAAHPRGMFGIPHSHSQNCIPIEYDFPSFAGASLTESGSQNAYLQSLKQLFSHGIASVATVGAAWPG
jgi:hypothetical protein